MCLANASRAKNRKPLAFQCYNDIVPLDGDRGSGKRGCHGDCYPNCCYR